MKLYHYASHKYPVFKKGIKTLGIFANGVVLHHLSLESTRASGTVHTETWKHIGQMCMMEEITAEQKVCYPLTSG